MFTKQEILNQNQENELQSTQQMKTDDAESRRFEMAWCLGLSQHKWDWEYVTKEQKLAQMEEVKICIVYHQIGILNKDKSSSKASSKADRKHIAFKYILHVLI